MTATPLTDVASRLLANVDLDHGDLADSVMRMPVSSYLDAERYQAEIDEIFLKVPLVTALSVDVRNPGDHHALEIAGRPIITVRGDDGVARTFINACRHRGAPVAACGHGHERRLSCPYHAWVFDNNGQLVGLPQREQFGDVDVTGLIELPTAERAGLIFTVLTPGLPIDLDEWLGDMASALEMLELDKLYRHEVTTELQSGNWKSTADGYLDGYHIGYLHRDNIGLKAINNRNTWDLYGPHVRLGFANKPIVTMRDVPVEEWDLTEAMSLVHYIFPNVSISGQPNRLTMFSRLLPTGVDSSLVVQYHYSREPIESAEQRQAMETRRKLYAAVTGDEDFSTVMQINRAFPAMATDDFLFGRNESGNQNLHTWTAKLAGMPL